MDEIIEKTMTALKKHGFRAEFVKDRAAAKEMMLTLIPAGAKVGVPGSASVRATGIVEALREKGHELYDHWAPGLSPADGLKLRKQQLLCDVLLTSTNALTASGELVNMDGIGNRAGAMIFGPGKVIIVAGKNKIVPDLAAGRDRIKTIAAPRRAKELNLNTPCAKDGVCNDCNTPIRICRAEVILHRAPTLTPIIVIIVDEELGN